MVDAWWPAPVKRCPKNLLSGSNRTLSMKHFHVIIKLYLYPAEFFNKNDGFFVPRADCLDFNWDAVIVLTDQRCLFDFFAISYVISSSTAYDQLTPRNVVQDKGVEAGAFPDDLITESSNRLSFHPLIASFPILPSNFELIYVLVLLMKAFTNCMWDSQISHPKRRPTDFRNSLLFINDFSWRLGLVVIPFKFQKLNFWYFIPFILWNFPDWLYSILNDKKPGGDTYLSLFELLDL